MRKIESGHYKLVFVTPERFAVETFKKLLDRMNREGKIARFAIDEIHVVGKWGDSFREAYHIMS